MRLADARFQQVQVLNTPGSGKDLAEGTGVHCEMGSEGSCFWYSFLRCGKQIILLFFMLKNGLANEQEHIADEALLFSFSQWG